MPSAPRVAAFAAITANLGPLLAALSFTLWGLLPLYYQFMPDVAMWELLSHRLLWSLPILLAILAWQGRRLDWAALRQQPQQLWRLLLAGPVMSTSWCLFTWCLTHGEILATSLAFFMTPLFNMIFACTLLGERLNRQKQLAVLLALAGLAYMLLSYGALPWYSLIMGAAFATYGLLKKQVTVDTTTSLTIETLAQLPFALFYLGYLTWTGSGLFWQGDVTAKWLLFGSAPVTLIPVAIFCMALARTPLSTVGLMQYIEPSLAFLLAIFYFGEAPDPIKSVGFAFVWAGLFVTLLPLPKRWRRAPLA
ncbi:MAG: EamA family transporter RarD [Aeromonas sp.]